MLGTDARINIVGFGAFRKDHKTFWSFDLNMRVEAEANMPYSLFDFLKNGRNEAVINVSKPRHRLISRPLSVTLFR